MNGSYLILGSCLISGKLSGSRLIHFELGGSARAALHAEHLLFRLPCWHPLHSAQSGFRLPWRQRLHSTQLPFCLP